MATNLTRDDSSGIVRLFGDEDHAEGAPRRSQEEAGASQDRRCRQAAYATPTACAREAHRGPLAASAAPADGACARCRGIRRACEACPLGLGTRHGRARSRPGSGRTRIDAPGRRSAGLLGLRSCTVHVRGRAWSSIEVLQRRLRPREGASASLSSSGPHASMGLDSLRASVLRPMPRRRAASLWLPPQACRTRRMCSAST